MPGAVCTAAPCPINEGQWAVGATGNVTNDHCHRFKEDVALMREMGLPYYCFSINWPRLCPLGDCSAMGGVNAKALTSHNALIDEAIAVDITPVVALYHWDLPRALLQVPYDAGRTGRRRSRVFDSITPNSVPCILVKSRYLPLGSDQQFHGRAALSPAHQM